MADLHSIDVERKLLSLLFNASVYPRVLDMNIDIFSITAHRELATLIKEYVKASNSKPTKDTIKEFAEVKLEEKNLDRLAEAIELMETLPEVESSEAVFYFDQAENYLIGRQLFDLRQEIGEELKRHKGDFKKLRQKVITKVLKMGSSYGQIDRGFINDREKVLRRVEEYKAVESGKSNSIIPYGIKDLDDALGGMARTFLSMFYSKTGGGKSMLGVNIAYNAAKAGYKVLYVSIEMAFDKVAVRFDSRLGKLDSKEILFGKLSSANKKVYNNTLKDLLKKDLNIWISDIPNGASTASVLNEIDLYTTANGILPDVVIVDYANIIKPVTPYQDRSQMFDHILA